MSVTSLGPPRVICLKCGLIENGAWAEGISSNEVKVEDVSGDWVSLLVGDGINNGLVEIVDICPKKITLKFKNNPMHNHHTSKFVIGFVRF